MKQTIICLLVTTFWILASCKRDNPEATRIWVEVDHAIREGGELRAAEESISGSIREKYKVTNFQHTHRVPLILGHGLGVIFHLEGRFRSLNAVRLKVSYPIMHSPLRGSLPGHMDRMQAAYDFDGDRVVDFSYFFDEAWELVEGKWHIEIWNESQILAEVDVYTYHPEEAKKADKS